MGIISRVTTWNSGDVLTAAALNGEFNAIVNDYNGSIADANIAANAAITPTKIAGTAVTLAGSESLSNKTVASPTISGTVAGSAVYTKPTLNGSIQALTTASDASTITFDLAASNVHTVTLGGNRTLALSNVAVGQPFILRLVQDGSGSRTVTWFSTIKWSYGVIPVLTTTASKTDVFGFICTSTDNYDGFIIGQNI